MDLCEFGFERCIDELFVVPQSALFRTFSSTYFRLVDYSTSFGCSNIFIMPLILLHTEIAAPIERCFDLARSMEVHVLSMRASGERIAWEQKSRETERKRRDFGEPTAGLPRTDNDHTATAMLEDFRRYARPAVPRRLRGRACL